MQILLELVAYLDSSIEPIEACSYDMQQYRPVPERARIVRFERPGTRGPHGYIRLVTHQMGWHRVLRRLIRETNPDLIHLNNVFFGTFGGAIAGRRAGLPVVAHARGFVHSRKLARRVIRFTVSQAVARNLMDNGVPSESVKVIYDPVVAPDGGPVARGGDGILHVGMMGMLQEWKGQHVFIEALGILRKRGTSFRATVAGCEPFGARGYEQRLREMVSTLQLEAFVQFTGFVSDQFRLYPTFDVAVHASIDHEPLARTAIEAMLSGVATVATSGGGMPELVHDGVTGLLVPMDDAHALADAIERLLRDDGLRRRLAEAGQHRARQMFDPVKHAREVEGVYAAVLGIGQR